MGRIAVAGGTGAVGKTIVEVLLQSKKHDVFVFTRKLPTEDSRVPGLSYLLANYDDIDGTVNTLESDNIDTIISAISIETEATSKAQINLITAADRSRITTRFIPSEYGFIATREIAKMDSSIQYWIDNAEAIKKTNLKYTRIANGFFLDYWGVPYLKTYLNPFPWAILVDKKIAAIPGSGNDVLSMTYSFDLAEFILRLLDDEDWPEIAALSGQDVTFNQLLHWAEAARGSKFDVKHDNEETLNSGNATILADSNRYDMIRSLTSLFGLMTIKGHLKMPEDYRVDKRYPDLKLMTVDQMIENIWTGR